MSIRNAGSCVWEAIFVDSGAFGFLRNGRYVSRVRCPETWVSARICKLKRMAKPCEHKESQAEDFGYKMQDHAQCILGQ